MRYIGVKDDDDDDDDDRDLEQWVQACRHIVIVELSPLKARLTASYLTITASLSLERAARLRQEPKVRVPYTNKTEKKN